MCNRIAIPSSSELKQQYPELDIQDFEANYHSMGYDHLMVPIITNLEPTRIQQARWGYVPDHVTNLASYETNTLNARNDTLFSTNTFKDAAGSRRCVIFVKGFFEFKKVNGVSYPHYIEKEDGLPYTFGGVWNNWKGFLTCSIVTTDANPLLANIHNVAKRMPFVLPRDQWDKWLDITQPQSSVEQMMQPYPVEDLRAYQVGGLLTTKGVDSNVPEVSKPIGPMFTGFPFPETILDPSKERKPKIMKKKDPPPNSSQMGLF